MGTHSIVAEFQSNGSFSQSSSAALSQIVNKAPTATTLAVFPNSSTSNEGVTLTAVVTVPSPGSTATAPTGTVQFVNTTTSQILGTAPLNLVGGVWTATLNVTGLNSGSQTQLLTATYSGDGNFATSTSPAQSQSVFVNRYHGSQRCRIYFQQLRAKFVRHDLRLESGLHGPVGERHSAAHFALGHHGEHHG